MVKTIKSPQGGKPRARKTSVLDDSPAGTMLLRPAKVAVDCRQSGIYALDVTYADGTREVLSISKAVARVLVAANIPYTEDRTNGSAT